MTPITTQPAANAGPKNNLYFIHCRSSLHAGAEATLSHVDLPIQREAFCNHPVVFGSTVKGAVRAHCTPGPTAERAEGKAGKVLTPETCVFGPEEATAAGMASFSDARLLLFPVASYRGVFAWLTCPFVLDRLITRMEELGLQVPTALGDYPLVTEEANAAAAEKSPLWLTLGKERRLILQEFDFSQETADLCTKAAALGAALGELVFASERWGKRLATHLAVVSDQSFDWMVRFGTEIIPHIKLDDEKQVENLWYEESLPPETVLFASVRIAPWLADGQCERFGSGSESAPAAAMWLDEQLVEKGNDGKVRPRVLTMGGNSGVGQGSVTFRRYPQ